MAFGTGEHETTSMVLEMMQEYIADAETVIDVGTGSGILGIAAPNSARKGIYDRYRLRSRENRLA